MIRSPILLPVTVLLFLSGTTARALDVVLTPPDAAALTVIRTVLGNQIRHEMQDPVGWRHFGSDLKDATMPAWVRIASAERPYLFVFITPECGASDCTIIGLRPVGDAWVKVYEVFGGDGLTVLDSITDGHHDLRQSVSRGGGHNDLLTSRWSKDRYAEPTRKPH